MAQNQGEARFSTEADKFMKTVTRVLPPGSSLMKCCTKISLYLRSGGFQKINCEILDTHPPTHVHIYTCIHMHAHMDTYTSVSVYTPVWMRRCIQILSGNEKSISGSEVLDPKSAR